MKNIFTLITICLHCLPVFTQTKGIIESSGSKLHYRVFGKGEPILIINGGPGMNSDGFADLTAELSAGNETIIYNQRGTGKSLLDKSDSKSVTMDLMVADIENLRNYFHIDKWVILGHSFGGMLASYYACFYPQHIKSVILSSSGGINLGLLTYVNKNISAKLSARERKEVSYWTKKINDGDTSHYARLQRGIALAPAYLYNRKYVPLIAERLTQGKAIINELIWQDLNKIKFDCATKLSAAGYPVLIIQGKEDIVSPETAYQSHRAFKNSTIIFLDHCVHYGWLDNRERYFEAIRNLLAKS